MPLLPTRKRSLPVLGTAALLCASIVPAAAAHAAGYGGLVPSAPSTSSPLSQAPSTASGLVPGEVIVRFEDPSEAASRVNAWGAELVLRIGLPGLVTAKFDDAADTVALAKQIAARDGVKWAEPNRTVETQATPNDPRMGELWGMNNGGQIIRGLGGIFDVDANVTEAWDVVTGGDAVVAVGDSGIAINHPDLAGNIWNNPAETGTDGAGRDKRTNGLDDDGNGRIDDWRGWDFVNNDNDPTDEQGHGTHVAGTIGAIGNNGQGIAGVSHRVKLMALKIGSNSRTDTSINADAAAAAMLYAAGKGVKVFNGSFGGPNPSQAQEDAIAASPNTLFVFAAGNSTTDNDQKPSYPCNFNRPNIVCVASITNQGALSSFSNFGTKSVDIGAPGSSVLSASPFTFTLDDPFEDPIAGRWTTPTTGAVKDAGWGVSPTGDGTKALKINDGKGLPGGIVTAIASVRLNLQTCVDPVWEMEVSSVLAGTGAFDVMITEDQNVNDAGKWVVIDSGTGTVGPMGLNYDLSKIDSNGDGQPDKNYAGKSVNLILGVRTSGAANQNQGPGPTVDNLKVSCKPNVFTGQEFEYKSGTSMASPMVAGAAGLVLNQFPGADMNYLRSAILRSVIPTPSLTSKTVTGGRLNVVGALDREGPAPFGLGEPGAGITTADPRPVFSWAGTSDAKTGINRYELVVDGAVVATTDANGRSGQPGAPLPVGNHGWRVDAVDGAGLRTSSETRPFTIIPPGPPLKIGKLAKITKARIAKSGFSIPCEIGQPGRCRVAVRLSRADAKKLKLKISKKSQTFLVAKGSKKIGKSGKVTVKIKPTKAIGNTIKRGKKKVTFLIEVIGEDAAGRQTVQTLSVRA